MATRKLKWNDNTLNILEKNNKTVISFVNSEGLTIAQYEFADPLSFNREYVTNELLCKLIGDQIAFQTFKRVSGLFIEDLDINACIESVFSADMSLGMFSQFEKTSLILKILHEDNVFAFAKLVLTGSSDILNETVTIDKYSPGLDKLVLELCEYVKYDLDILILDKLEAGMVQGYNVGNYKEIYERGYMGMLDSYCDNHRGDIKKIYCVPVHEFIIQTSVNGKTRFYRESSKSHDDYHNTFDECLLYMMFPINFNSVLVLYRNDNNIKQN